MNIFNFMENTFCFLILQLFCVLQSFLMKTLTLMDINPQYLFGNHRPRGPLSLPWSEERGQDFQRLLWLCCTVQDFWLVGFWPTTLRWKALSGHHVVVFCFTTPRALCGPNRQSLVAPKGQKIAQFHCYIIYLCSSLLLFPEVQARVVTDAVCGTLSFGIWGVESNEYQRRRKTEVKKGSRLWFSTASLLNFHLSFSVSFPDFSEF